MTGKSARPDGTRSAPIAPPALPKGGRVQVRFAFTCRLSEGAYFVNCGVTELVDGHDVFLHRIVDALQFRVLPCLEREGDMTPTGLVDMGLRGTVSIA